MAELLESMKTGEKFNPQAAASELDAQRNRARLQQQLAQPPLNVPQASGSTQGQGQQGASNGATQAGVAAPDPAAKQRVRADQIRRVSRGRRENGREEETPADPDYPNPIGLRSFIAFGFIAVCQDFLPLILDLIGIGWLIGWMMFPFTWIAYLYLIIRHAPKPLKKKFLQRTAMASGVGLIPVVGEFMPEWTVTAILVYVFTRRYQQAKTAQATGEASRANSEKSAAR